MIVGPHVQHPTYKAFVELSKAIKTIFLSRYLNREALRRKFMKVSTQVWSPRMRRLFPLSRSDPQRVSKDPEMARRPSGGSPLRH